MRNTKLPCIAVLLFFFAGQPASAQQEVILDHVTNSIGDTALAAGNTHILNFRFRNLPPDSCRMFWWGDAWYDESWNPNNGFILFSPDGATWNLSVGNFTQAFINAADPFWHGRFVNHFENPNVGGDSPSGPNDGVSPDYIVFSAFAPPTFGFSGMPAGFDEIALQIEIESNLADTGLTICIDSSNIGRLNTFTWGAIGNPQCHVVPVEWGGPYCFTIVANCCQGATGNIDFDHAGLVDIADLTFLIDHLFINFPELPCSDQANLNGSPDGRVDISDLTILIDHLFINFPQLPVCQ